MKTSDTAQKQSASSNKKKQQSEPHDQRAVNDTLDSVGVITNMSSSMRMVQRECSCGGTCPECRAEKNGSESESVYEDLQQAPMASSKLSEILREGRDLVVGDSREKQSYKYEERSANHAVSKFWRDHASVPENLSQLQEHRGAPTLMNQGLRQQIEPYTGALPSSVMLRSGSEVDQVLSSRRARGMAMQNEIWLSNPTLMNNDRGAASVLIHEAAHVASGASNNLPFPNFPFDDPLGDETYNNIERRQREIEEQETGVGREHLLSELEEMSDEDAMRRLPGIVERAQLREDIELAERSSRRLLEAWLNSPNEVPSSLSVSFSMEGSVDHLIQLAETAFANNHLTLGGNYLSIAIVQLVRYANQTVARRTLPNGDEVTRFLSEAFLDIQRQTESEVLERIERVHNILLEQANVVIESQNENDALTFEEVASLFERAEAGAGARVSEDLGTGGVDDSQQSQASSSGGRRRSNGNSVDLQQEPSIPEIDEEAPVVREDERIVEEVHPHLEGMTVFYRTSRLQYAQVQSPRYGIAGTFSGARRMANAFFGRRSSVIVEEFFARDRETGARRVKYIVLELNTRVNPPAQQPAEGEVVGFSEDYQWIFQPANHREYLALSIVTGDWLFFPPSVHNHISQLQGEEYNVDAERFSDSELRDATFATVDDLINQGSIQDAANQLTDIGAVGFQLASAEQKVLYLVTLLNAITFEQNERTVVAVFEGVSGRDELRAVLHGLHNEGVLNKLYTDMDYAFGQLLMTIGRRFGAPSLSNSDVMGLLNEIRINSGIPGIQVSGDGEVYFDLSPEIGDELWSALEGFLDTISAAVTGVADMILDPEAFFKGLGQLLYFVIMLRLSTLGNLDAQRHVGQVVAGISRHLGQAVHGLAIIQQNVPSEAQFVREVQRNLKWRIIWEVVGLFVGVGEVIAFVDALKGARALEALSALSRGVSGLRQVTRFAEGSSGARLFGLVDSLDGRPLQEAHFLTVIDSLAIEEQGRIAALIRSLDEGAELAGETLEAVQSVKRQADTIAQVQSHLGGDMTRATGFWSRARQKGIDGDELVRIVDDLPTDATARANALNALEQISHMPSASAEMIQAVARSPLRVQAVESIGPHAFETIWNRAGGDPARADDLIRSLESQRTSDPVAWQRRVDEYRDPHSEAWRELDPPVRPRNPEQERLLRVSGDSANGSNLNAAQRAAETDIVGRSPRRISTREGYLYEVDIGNGHHWRQRADGTWCRFSERSLCGTRIAGTELTGDLTMPSGRLADDVHMPERQPDVDADPALVDGLRVDERPSPGMTDSNHNPNRQPGVSNAQGEAGVLRHTQEVLDELTDLQGQGRIAGDIPNSVPMATAPPNGVTTRAARQGWQETLEELGQRVLDPNDAFGPRDLAEVFGPAGAREVRMPVHRGTRSGVRGSRLIDHFYPNPNGGGVVMRESKNLQRFMLDSHTSRELLDDMTLLQHPAFHDSIALWRIDSTLAIHRNTLQALQRRVLDELGENLLPAGGQALRYGRNGRLIAPNPLRLETASGRFIFDLRILPTPF